MYTLYFVGDLKKVDESHFHMFEIPKDCASLSDLRCRVMPTFEPISGYGYRQYVTGESVHPNERILLLDRVKTIVLLNFSIYHRCANHL